jgi:hypothetical protein
MSHFAMNMARAFRSDAALKGLLIPIITLATFTGCGASSVAPVPVQQVEVVPEPVQELDTRIFYVFVREIQALTIYPDGGPIRNERRSGETPPWGTNSEHFAIFSNWHGAEDEVASAISAAVSLDDLLQRLAALPGVRIEEGLNPAYEAL